MGIPCHIFLFLSAPDAHSKHLSGEPFLLFLVALPFLRCFVIVISAPVVEASHFLFLSSALLSE